MDLMLLLHSGMLPSIRFRPSYQTRMGRIAPVPAAQSFEICSVSMIVLADSKGEERWRVAGGSG